MQPPSQFSSCFCWVTTYVPCGSDLFHQQLYTTHFSGFLTCSTLCSLRSLLDHKLGSLSDYWIKIASTTTKAPYICAVFLKIRHPPIPLTFNVVLGGPYFETDRYDSRGFSNHNDSDNDRNDNSNRNKNSSNTSKNRHRYKWWITSLLMMSCFLLVFSTQKSRLSVYSPLSLDRFLSNYIKLLCLIRFIELSFFFQRSLSGRGLFRFAHCNFLSHR